MNVFSIYYNSIYIVLENNFCAQEHKHTEWTIKLICHLCPSFVIIRSIETIAIDEDVDDCLPSSPTKNKKNVLVWFATFVLFNYYIFHLVRLIMKMMMMMMMMMGIGGWSFINGHKCSFAIPHRVFPHFSLYNHCSLYTNSNWSSLVLFHLSS